MSVVVFELRARQVAVVHVESGGTEVVTLPDPGPPTSSRDCKRVAAQAGSSYAWVGDPAAYPDATVRDVYQRLAPAPKPTDLCRDCAASPVCAVYQAAVQLDLDTQISSCSAFTAAEWGEDA